MNPNLYGVLLSSASEANGPLVIPVGDRSAAQHRLNTILASQPGIKGWLMIQYAGSSLWTSTSNGHSPETILQSL